MRCPCEISSYSPSPRTCAGLRQERALPCREGSGCHRQHVDCILGSAGSAFCWSISLNLSQTYGVIEHLLYTHGATGQEGAKQLGQVCPATKHWHWNVNLVGECPIFHHKAVSSPTALKAKSKDRQAESPSQEDTASLEALPALLWPLAPKLRIAITRSPGRGGLGYLHPTLWAWPWEAFLSGLSWHESCLLSGFCMLCISKRALRGHWGSKRCWLIQHSLIFFSTNNCCLVRRMAKQLLMDCVSWDDSKHCHYVPWIYLRILFVPSCVWT